MADFLLEIGTEELPSRFLKSETRELASLLGQAFSEAGLTFDSLETSATPRRLVAQASGLPLVQPGREETVMGPALKIAYDQNGQPSKALLGFIKSNGLDAAEISSVQTPKGEYVKAVKRVVGKPVIELLAEICPRVIGALSFAKRMRWGDNDQAYARPIRWILALLDDKLVPLTFGPIQSDRKTRGHRIHGNGPFDVPTSADYAVILKEKGGVILDPQGRQKQIVETGNRLAAEKSGEIIWKDELLEEVSGLVEHPEPMLGEFSPEYLELPEEVLLTSMQSHQKSFGCRGHDGKLLPCFLTVANLSSTDPLRVKKGWERVLRARLEDARFFWKSDLGQQFSDWLEKLEHVIFIGPLGSMGDKARRLVKLCEWLVNEELPELDAKLAMRAASLAKADLVSGMVGEFASLQGIMGGIYAREAGESPEVAAAIQEQYLPAGPDSPLPQSPYGALLSLADKADTLAGCFGLNMIPSGMADPNGLRRCALGIIRIALAQNMDFSLSELFAQARANYGEQKWKLSEADSQKELLNFMSGRLRNYFIGEGYETIFVDAALASGLDRIPDLKKRLDALTAFSGKEHFVEHAQLLKRVANIIKKSEDDKAAWQKDALCENAEKELASKLEEELPKIDALLQNGAYAEVLDKLALLGQPVNSFFDNVMVMSEDAKLRANRLALLKAIHKRFDRVGKFALLQV